MESTIRTEEVIDLGIHHKVCAVLIILGASALLFQVLMFSGISDNLIMDIAFEVAKDERDKTTYAPGMRAYTDEELRKRLESERKQIVSEAKEAVTSPMGPLIGTIALFIIGFNILRKKLKYLRAFAGIMAVLLTLGFILTYRENSEMMSLFARVKHPEMSLLILSNYTLRYCLPVAALACFVILIAPPKAEMVKHTQFYYDEPPKEDN